MPQGEPPSCRSSAPSIPFLLGRNSCGNWVVQDERGVRGGLFVSRAEAVRFARRENGNRPTAIAMVPGTFELDLSGRAIRPAATVGETPFQRVA